MEKPMSADKPASLRSLVSDATRDAKHLFEVQKELAKAEMDANKKAAAATGGAFSAAGVMAAVGAFFLLLTIAFILYVWLPLWASFGIVTLTLFIIAGVAAAIGQRKAKDIKGIPLTKAEIDRTKAALGGGASTDVALVGGKAAAPAARDAS
jgi:VIT1/CCC1 family predicted Fe2+/Mn2+ transporter